MQKIIFSLISILILWAVGIYITLYTDILQGIDSKDSLPWAISENKNNEDTQEKEDIDSEELVRDKINTIRKRLALKWLIIQGDSYYQQGQIIPALQKFLEFYRKNPNDELIIEKLGDTYFELNKFTSAQNYYSKIINPSEKILEKRILSFIYNSDLSDPASLQKLKDTIATLQLEDQQQYYYQTSLECVSGFHECKKSLWAYFWPKDETQEVIINYGKLENIKQAISNYQNFQVDDVYLKDAFIIASWYSDAMYPLAINMWEKLLQEKTGYKPVLKIVAQSYYELWEYKKARAILWEYYEIDNEDIAVNYLLWVINTKLREYVLANIYFNKSISLGYADPVEIRRQLIHNFYLLENDENILKQFVTLIDETTWFEASDLSLWIYYHILNEQYVKALNWARKWKDIFSDAPGNFYAYEAWILREQWDIENSNIILQQWIEIDSENPFLLINLGYNALKEDKLWVALIHFKKVISSAPESEFALQAREEIEKLQ